MKKWIYLFNEVKEVEKFAGGSWDGVKSIVGGKGAGLFDMTRAGVPVPPFFTVTTEACNAFQAGGKFPAGMWNQELKALKIIEQATAKKFGDAKNPLLVSCRSGAKFSMPGMMNTILNIGLNDAVTDGLAEATNNPRFAYDSYRRLVEMFGTVVMDIADEAFEYPLHEYKAKKGYKLDTEMTAQDWKAVAAIYKEVYKKESGGDFPQDPYDQLSLATEAVFRSWNGKRAVNYRNKEGISHTLGTAVNICTMVFGNMGDDSATGVAFTRNPSTGDHKMMGEYLINAQGEDVVAGIRNTDPIENLEKNMPAVYKQLMDITTRLESYYKDMQDLEFAIESGKLWILLTRNGKRTSRAAINIAVDLLEEGVITPQEAVFRITPEVLLKLFSLRIPDDVEKNTSPISRGVNASSGAAQGLVTFDADSAEKLSKSGKNVILMRPFVKPDDVHGMIASKGVVTSEGGATSHAAVVCRQFGIPSVVGASSLKINLDEKKCYYGSDTFLVEGDEVTIDGTTGRIYLGKLPLLTPKIENDRYLLSYASLLWKISPDEVMPNSIGKFWLLRDIIKYKMMPWQMDETRFYQNDFFESLANQPAWDESVSFIQPSKEIIEHVIKELLPCRQSDLQIISLGIFYNLMRILQEETGIGNHPFAIRPLCDPLQIIIDLKKRSVSIPSDPKHLIEILSNRQIESQLQLIGVEFFGINRYIKNFLEWANIQWWAVVDWQKDQDILPWRLDKTNPNGENVIPGSSDIVEFVLTVNDKILTMNELNIFYNELRKREIEWSWYSENNMSWRSVLGLLTDIKERVFVDSKPVTGLQSVGLLDRQGNLSEIGLSVISEQISRERRKISFCGRLINE